MALCRIARPLTITADDLHRVDADILPALTLEHDVFDQKGPDVVAEAVGVEVAFEVEAGLDALGEHLGDDAVEVVEDLHGELGLDASVVDEVVDRVDEGFADADTGYEDCEGEGERLRCEWEGLTCCRGRSHSNSWPTSWEGPSQGPLSPG